MFCKNCGIKLDDNAKFCPDCGTRVEKPTESQTVVDPQEKVFVEDSNIENVAQESMYNAETPAQPDGVVAEEESPKQIKVKKILKKAFLGGVAVAVAGVALFIAAIIWCLIESGGLNLCRYAETLTIIGIITTAAGFVLVAPLWIVNATSKKYRFVESKKLKTYALVLAVLCLGLFIWGVIDKSNTVYPSGSYYGGSYNNNYSSGVNKSIGLSMKVDRITTSGSYTYVYCSITNVSSKYVATRYRYVKVKAQFKNYSGSIVDTDWTYAVDSTWIEPGETKTFYYMVKNTNIKSATLSFAD